MSSAILGLVCEAATCAADGVREIRLNIFAEEKGVCIGANVIANEIEPNIECILPFVRSQSGLARFERRGNELWFRIEMPKA